MLCSYFRLARLCWIAPLSLVGMQPFVGLFWGSKFANATVVSLSMLELPA